MLTLAKRLPYRIGANMIMDILQKQDIEEASKLVADIFYEEDPGFNYLKLHPSATINTLVKFQQHFSNPMLGVGVKNENGKIIGTNLNGELHIQPIDEGLPAIDDQLSVQILTDAEDLYRAYYFVYGCGGQTISRPQAP